MVEAELEGGVPTFSATRHGSGRVPSSGSWAAEPASSGFPLTSSAVFCALRFPTRQSGPWTRQRGRFAEYIPPYLLRTASVCLAQSQPFVVEGGGAPTQ